MPGKKRFSNYCSRDRYNIKEKKRKQTYNTRYSLVVTDPTTNLAVSGLSRGERTGSRVPQILWSDKWLHIKIQKLHQHIQRQISVLNSAVSC
ncbi:hypothetical protein F4781DRAFT_404543 [Annulohypoxylon bovei var. microspora]|nr:hypothetical protein F4781DRAFT_404543 [Annulohypoxylon bovei var. microspora]